MRKPRVVVIENEKGEWTQVFVDGEVEIVVGHSELAAAVKVEPRQDPESVDYWFDLCKKTALEVG